MDPIRWWVDFRWFLRIESSCFLSLVLEMREMLLAFSFFNTGDVSVGMLEIQSVMSDLLYRELALHVNMEI